MCLSSLSSKGASSSISAVQTLSEKDRHLCMRGVLTIWPENPEISVSSQNNGKAIFRKFRSEIVEYLQRYSSFSVRNGKAEISLPFTNYGKFNIRFQGPSI